MSRSKKVFLSLVLGFFLMLVYLSYDISSRTTFPGSKPQLKERIMKHYQKKPARQVIRDTAVSDTSKSIHR